jgi:nucleoid-associated protein YgaU
MSDDKKGLASSVRSKLSDQGDAPKKQFIRSAVGMQKATTPEPEEAAELVDSLEEAAEPEEVEHTVAAGESLSLIAQKYYDSQNEWPRIYRANKAIIGDDPNRIRVGQKLTIPPK